MFPCNNNNNKKSSQSYNDCSNDRKDYDCVLKNICIKYTA